ncbi:MAG: MCE family protein [Nitrospinae bacterium]|nr:MCE family protein [Nitrospinota bacterium]
MKNWTNEAKLGVFIIAGFAVLFWLTFSIGGKKLFSVTGKKSFIVYFKTITGVTEKSDVRMAGVKIGEVKKVELENYRAKVTVGLHGDYDVPDDSVATVQGKGLLGEKFIEIRPGFSPTYVSNGGVLANSIPPSNIDDMVAKLSAALDDIKTVTNSLSESFGSEEGKQGLKSIISNLSNLSKDLNDVVGGNKEKLTQIITNVDKATAVLQLILTENRENLRGSISNLNSMSKSFAEKAPDLLEHLDQAASGIRDMVSDNRTNLKDSMSNIKEASGNFNGVLVENRENFKVAMANLKTSSEKLDEIMASVKKITAKIEKGEGTIGKLVQEEEVYNGLNETLEGAKNLTKQTGAMKVGIGARAEYQSEMQQSKSYFSIRVKPREDKYYMIEVSEDVRRNLGTGPRNTLNSLLYSFYIAKRFGNVTIKGGLMESSGGVGLDLHGWEDKLMLTADVFNFSGYDNNAKSPQVKVTAKYFPQKYLFLYVGGDELANKYYRTFFGGIGIMADEEDFKFFMARFF